MKKTKMLLVAISMLLLCSIVFNLTGCMRIKAENLMDGITPRQISAKDDLSDQNVNATDFAIRIFKATNDGSSNTLISPLSIMCALAMTANGAEGNTRAQIEAVLGMTVEELNLYLYTYISTLPEGEKYKLKLANSIWFTNDKSFTVNREFLQTNADYYSADIYQAPFNSRTLKDINNWVKSETDKMIPKILKEIPKDAIMYLINALAFDAEWTKTYKSSQVHTGTFTKENGTEQSVEMMYCEERRYLEDDNATGFIKYYNGYKYAFVALLPNEGVSVDEYVKSLDGESLSNLLSNVSSATVKTAIPKFETEYDADMANILKSMGMTDAFDKYNADFSSLGTYGNYNIFINRVLHKTHIQVGEKGTKAGAVTAVEMNKDTATDPGEEEIKKVYLDRPFVYMLIDCENNIPFFIGTMMDVNG